MYYLTYRPQKISDIDNKERRKILQKLFSNPKSVPHALLLVGPKGTGKTSTARIIAKILNCHENIFAGKGKSPEPCGTCSSCTAISKGRFIDVHELDAASNRRVDDVRALREEVKFAPSQARYKLYIIDEVHMLTNEAFNALLKTLEEPPKNVVFILATTEENRLPSTIISRCMRIPFSKASINEIVSSLQRICINENIKAEKRVLERIALFSRGSFRDGAKMLEFAYQTTDMSVSKVERALYGAADKKSLELLEYIFSTNLKKALEWINSYANNGGNMASLIEILLYDVHRLLLIYQGLKDPSPEFEYIVKKVHSNSIARITKLLLEAYTLMKTTPVDTLPLSIAVVEYCEKK